MNRPPSLSRTTSQQSSLSVHSVSDAALWGAATAFGRAAPTPTPLKPSHSGVRSNGALAAATVAGRGVRSPSPNLASPAPKPAVKAKPRRLSLQTSSAVPVTGEEPTDTTPVAPTSALVKLFERKTQTPLNGQGDQSEPAIIKPGPTLTISSPKPLKAKDGITTVFRLDLEDSKSQPENASEGKSNLTTSTDIRDFAASPTSTAGLSSPDSFASASDVVEPLNSGSLHDARRSFDVGLRGSEFRLEKQETLPRPATAAPLPFDAQHSVGSSPVPRGRLPRSATGNTALPTGEMTPQPPLRRPSSVASDQTPFESTHQLRSVRSIQAQYNQAYPRQRTQLRSGDDLANALVASSLASSRAPSPRRHDPPPVPTRRRNKASSSHHHIMPFNSSSISRTPSPAKTGMLHTLRKQHTDDSDTSGTDDEKHPYAKHQKRRLVRKHPNKHHEGDRKRWRDAVTERERKRYEGVWAANRGLHLLASSPVAPTTTTTNNDLKSKSTVSLATTLLTTTSPSAADQIASIVARDIWARSRLPDPVLATVWDLVDNQRAGQLLKEEFVVGLWLIDQRLKGRKLPVKVSESVWLSVRALEGIKIKIRK